MRDALRLRMLIVCRKVKQELHSVPNEKLAVRVGPSRSAKDLDTTRFNEQLLHVRLGLFGPPHIHDRNGSILQDDLRAEWRQCESV